MRLANYFSLLFSVLFLFSCTQKEEKQSIEQVKTEIQKILTFQEKAWSDGDFEGFMSAYWKSDSLRFMGTSKLTYGWHGMLNDYKKGYPTPEDRGKLSFKLISLEYIGQDHLVMLGEFHLSRKEDLKGNFSLLWKKINGEWKIIFDHT